MFAKSVKYIGDRKTFDEEKLDGLEEIVQDAGKAAAVLDAAQSSMGKVRIHNYPLNLF